MGREDDLDGAELVVKSMVPVKFSVYLRRAQGRLAYLLGMFELDPYEKVAGTVREAVLTAVSLRLAMRPSQAATWGRLRILHRVLCKLEGRPSIGSMRPMLDS